MCAAFAPRELVVAEGEEKRRSHPRVPSCHRSGSASLADKPSHRSAFCGDPLRGLC